MTSPVTSIGAPAGPTSVPSARDVPGNHSSEEPTPPAVVEISAEGQRRAEARASEPHLHALSEAAARAEALEAASSGGVHPHSEPEHPQPGAEESEALSDPEQEEVTRMQRRDAEVRAHEAAHMAAGGGLTGGASYNYETGPDGKRYATGGEVGIRMGRGRTPEETIARAQTIRAAALAPAEPSSQDRAVASAAARMESTARQELARQRAAEAGGTSATEESEGDAE